jgi:hypothetical protein
MKILSMVPYPGLVINILQMAHIGGVVKSHRKMLELLSVDQDAGLLITKDPSLLNVISAST